MRDFLQHARSFHADLTEMRRDIHRHPELAFQETRTAGIAADALDTLGLHVTRGVGGTGVVAELRNGAGPVVVLRADMDALPVTEINETEYVSTVPGVMHACGHDAHVTMLLGAARLLNDAADAGDLPSGTVRFLFQPAEEKADEENRSGADHLVAAGAMHGVDAAFALHVAPHLPARRIYTREGGIMAGSDTFVAWVLGDSSHGARPDEGVDALVLAAHVVLAAQHGVARRISPMKSGVLTIGSIDGGTAENIIADRVRLEGTIRYFDPQVRERLRAALEAATRVAETMGGRVEMDLLEGYPPTINDPAMTRLAREATAAVLGDDGVADVEPMMATEDFAVLLRHAPGALLWLGAAP
ncbi:MAG TPA: amidohydrolase, partial [Longimicrobiales bacterium]|nr:amidohydrolase [Longimicrobiales bacterium]